ncbi:MAG: beta-ketoacyl-[acyl-carrier-protein] synthase family protein [Planctomycetales bacterium]
MRIAVTGIGMVTPLGGDRETSWRRIVAGEGALRWLDGECGARSAECGARWAGAPALVGEPPGSLSDLRSSTLDHRPSTGLEPVIELALRAAREAVADAGLDLATLDRDRVGCVIGTSKGSLRTFADEWSKVRSQRSAVSGQRSPAGDRRSKVGGIENRTRSAEGVRFPAWSPNAAAAAVAAEFDLRGAALCPVAACATGLSSILRGADLIREGACDVVLAGSSDASLCAAVLASFRRMGVLARDFDDPAAACRPFDRRRNGFLVGEGAAVLVLERADRRPGSGRWTVDSGQKRNADGGSARSTVHCPPSTGPYAELLAAGSLADLSGLTALDPEARALTRLIGDVLRRGGVPPDEVDYVNLHGTATVANDLCETRAVHRAFGAAAGGVACSSLKGAFGHLLGAAGSVETACTLLAVRDGLVPPTVNLDQPGAGCDLDYTPHHARPRAIRHALKLSLGFGGHLVAALFRRFDAD